MLKRDEVLAYARSVKAVRPSITAEELEATLRARFIDGKDPLATGALGAVANPMDWLLGLSVIFAGIAKLLGKDYSGAVDVIRGVVIIVQNESA